MASRQGNKMWLLVVVVIGVVLLHRLKSSEKFGKFTLPLVGPLISRFSRAFTSCPLKEPELRDPMVVKTALANYPCSGARLLRQLIEQTTGIATGSVYCEEEEELFVGDCIDDDTVLTINTHEWFDKHKYHKALILIRNPYDTFRTLYSQNIGKEILTDSDLDSEHFKKYINKMLPNWRWYNEEWMRDFNKPKLVVYLDKLKKDPVSEMKKILQFLDVEYNKHDFDCMLYNFGSALQRTSRQTVDIRNHLTEKQLTETEDNIIVIEKMAEKINNGNFLE